MFSAFHLVKLLSAAAFLYYGVFCMVSASMVLEFERYGLARLRMLVGALEVAGALGLLAGFLLPALDVWAGGGLCLMMLAGIATRVRIGDPWTAMVPAAVLLLLNVGIVVVALRRSQA